MEYCKILCYHKKFNAIWQSSMPHLASSHSRPALTKGQHYQCKQLCQCLAVQAMCYPRVKYGIFYLAMYISVNLAIHRLSSNYRGPAPVFSLCSCLAVHVMTEGATKGSTLAHLFKALGKSYDVVIILSQELQSETT